MPSQGVGQLSFEQLGVLNERALPEETHHHPQHKSSEGSAHLPTE